MLIAEKTSRVEELVAITKSDSGISGPELAKAHIELGYILGEYMKDLDPNETTIVAIMRGALFFAEGLYFNLGCRFEIFDPKTEKFKRPCTKNVIIVDAVINTGSTIRKIAEENVRIACCVINERAVPMFEKNLYTIRVSRNSFIGSNVTKQEGNIGPDTTMRLFNQI